MGFNKRFLTKELIINTKEKMMSVILNADALIMDKWSSKFVELYEQGLSKDEILKMLENE